MASLRDNVRRALDHYSLSEIENSLVAAYLACAPVSPQPGSDLAVAVNASQSALEAALVADCPAHLWTLNDLVMCFETLVPPTEAATYGAVFTPSAITGFMAQLAVDTYVQSGRTLTDATVCDPAVGCGALLVAALHAICARTGEPASDVAARLYGTDISAHSIHRARLLLALACVSLGDARTPQLHLNVTNALDTQVTRSFDIVLANPPYVRYQQLDETTRATTRTTWATCAEGNFNLYFPFFELAAKLTSASGVAVYITPNGFLTSKSARPLRSWLSTSGWLDTVVDFGPHRVFDAMTYTAITVASPSQSTSFGYLEVAGLDGLAKLTADWRDTACSRYDLTRLGAQPWQLVNTSDRAAVETIAAAGTKLSDLAHIGYGLATLRDKLFTVDGTVDADGRYVTSYGGVTYLVEAGLTRPVIKMSGADQASLATNRARIICPYDYTDGTATLIDEATLRARYPHGYHYLCAIKGELAKRDKGYKTYPQWYAYGRTQGLAPLGNALLTPLYADRPRFLHTADLGDDTFMLNGCAVKLGGTDHIDVDTLALLLNSGVTHYFIEATSHSITGGFYAYQKTQLGALGIPALTVQQTHQITDAPTAGEQDDLIAAVYGITLPVAYRRR